jgi:hypothetical protein
MKKLTTAAAVLFLSTAAVQAADLGNGVTAGAEIDAWYGVDAEALTMTLSPEIGYSIWDNDLSLSTDINVYKDQEFVMGNSLDSMILDFEVTRDIWSNIEAYAKTSWDLDTRERGEISIGGKFSF